MNKYIDADRLRAEIEKRKQVHFDDYFIKNSGNPADYGASNALAQVISLIDSIQQEQPELPDNIDEAAEEFYKEIEYYPPSLPLYNKHVRDAFKAGAEWMAGQGETAEGHIVDEISYNGVAVVLDNEGQFKPGDKVIVQIRKK